jgi:Glycosyl transferase family 11
MSRHPERDRFLVVGLRGGLGNQLFQYAAGLGIAAQLDAELYADSHHLRADERWLPELWPGYREVDRARLLRVGILRTGGDGWHRVLPAVVRRASNYGRRIRGKTPPRVPVGDDIDDAGRFRESLFSIDTPSYLWGFFQSERYFSSVADDVGRTLRLPSVPLPAPMRSRTTVAVSFRRGDYVRLGWELPLDYYERALELVAREVQDPTFLLFGDDPVFLAFAVPWVARFGPAVSAYEIAADELSHLALLATCDHSVIANSSFAWWGAWLGDRRSSGRRLVVAPEQYRRNWGDDILPAHWSVVQP